VNNIHNQRQLIVKNAMSVNVRRTSWPMSFTYTLHLSYV